LGANCVTKSGVQTTQQVRRNLQTQGFSVNLNEYHIKYILKAPTFDNDREELFLSPLVMDSYSPTPTKSASFAPQVAHHRQEVQKEKPPWLT